MKKIRFASGCLLPAVFAAICAHAQAPDELAVTFLATDPAPDAQLARNERFYVRFSVKSAAPVAVMINAYSDGNPVFADMGSSTVNQLPAGETIAVAHFFYWGTMMRHIDEVRLTVGAPATPGKGREFALPEHLTLTPQEAAMPRTSAPWVTKRQRDSGAPRQSVAATDKPAARPILLSLIVAAAAVALTIIAYLVLRSRRKPRRDDAR